MCGRFGLDIRPDKLAEHFGVQDPPVLAPRYNICPSQDAACVMVHPETGSRVVRKLRFGLVPHWAGDVKIGYKMINARAETVREKPAFRGAFAKRRLIVPASGFFEWQKQNGKQPWYYFKENGEPLGLAGLWEHWRGDADGELLFSFTIITVPANSLVEKVHERMPAVLKPADYEGWLTEADPEAAHEMLAPFPPEELAARPVSKRVNSPRNDDPSIIEGV
jgi:putative SOS response-associated peptidase YedK